MNVFLKEVLEGLTEEEKKNCNGYWTYAHSKELLWEHNPFKTKDEAIAAGREVFPCGFTIGELKNNDENMVYNIINIEKLSFS